jgi:acyl-CoA dehydrogenase
VATSLNGSKTFISNGMRADYYTVVAHWRPGADPEPVPGRKGMPGFTQHKMRKMGWHCSDTATLFFDDVELPPENLLGPENKGFLATVKNLNNERAGLASGACAYARCAVEEAHEWATQRETFGKPLIKNQVIRHKFAEMMRHISASQALADLMVWHMMQDRLDIGMLSLAKVQSPHPGTGGRGSAQILGGACFRAGLQDQAHLPGRAAPCHRRRLRESCSTSPPGRWASSGRPR